MLPKRHKHGFYLTFMYKTELNVKVHKIRIEGEKIQIKIIINKQWFCQHWYNIQQSNINKKNKK